MRIFLKILIGILAFIIGGIITVLVILPILNSFIFNEIMLNTIQIIFNIGIAILIYRLAVKNLLKSKKTVWLRIKLIIVIWHRFYKLTFWLIKTKLTDFKRGIDKKSQHTTTAMRQAGNRLRLINYGNENGSIFKRTLPCKIPAQRIAAAR